MRLRVRREHHGVRQIRLSQRRAGRFGQRKIGQAVVDDVYRQIAMPKYAPPQTEIGRAGDHRF